MVECLARKILRHSSWKLTAVLNLRPVIVADQQHRVLLWLRGDFVTYTNYQLDVVGIVEEIE